MRVTSQHAVPPPLWTLKGPYNATNVLFNRVTSQHNTIRRSVQTPVMQFIYKMISKVGKVPYFTRSSCKEPNLITLMIDDDDDDEDD
jgi:hypothetical protein